MFRHGHKNREPKIEPESNPKPNRYSKITERFLYFYNPKTETGVELNREQLYIVLKLAIFLKVLLINRITQIFFIQSI